MKKTTPWMTWCILAALLISCSSQTAPSASSTPDQPTHTPALPSLTSPVEPTMTTAVAVTPTASATASPAAPTLDPNERIRSAKVLVYEDVMSEPDLDLLPLAHKALGLLGITDVVEVGDATRWFLEQINSGTDWDLIIVVAEAHEDFKGELFDGILSEVERGTAVILELRFLNEIYAGRIAPLLEQCGLAWQKGIGRERATYDPINYSYVWLDEGHALVTTPNAVFPPTYPYEKMWGDAGDMLKLEPGSSSKLVAGALPDHPDMNGVLASCMDNRVILQTFPSHDYLYGNMILLWQNYIVNALNSHFSRP